MTKLHGSLSTVEYFTFGFGTMIGVGWLVLMDDWLTRGGPGGAMLGFAIGGLLLFPIAHTYGRLVERIQDAGAEIAYTEGVFPPFVSFAAASVQSASSCCSSRRSPTTSYAANTSRSCAGVAIPAGSCATVGIGGQVLGGGIGFLSRKLGTTSDNLLSLTLVTADGSDVNSFGRTRPYRSMSRTSAW